jgi:hypothetical protein
MFDWFSLECFIQKKLTEELKSMVNQGDLVWNLG